MLQWWKWCVIYSYIIKAIKLIIIEASYHYQLHTTFYPIFQGQLHMYLKLLGIISVDFDVIDQMLEKKWECSGTVHQLFV
jgi:hypothetical protein